jgi:hypothetical protein
MKSGAGLDIRLTHLMPPTRTMMTSRCNSMRIKGPFHRPTAFCMVNWKRKIEEALADLPENQRTAILLCRGDELSYEDIAQVLGCSLSATKSLIHRGRETLKEKLKPYLRSGCWPKAK